MPTMKVKLSDFAADLNLPVQELIDRLRQLDPTKEIIVGEVGWPTKYNYNSVTVGSVENSIACFNGVKRISEEKGVVFLWFSAHDENWKASQEGPILRREADDADISPDTAGGADLQLFGGDVAPDRAFDDDGIGTHIHAGHTACFPDNDHPADLHVAFEGPFDAHTARAAQAPAPVDARAQNRSDPFNGCDAGLAG